MENVFFCCSTEKDSNLKDEEIVFSAGFGDLPDVPLLKVFRYLTIDELCLAGRVCSRWHELSKSPLLWKSVDLHHIQLSSVQIEKLFHILPNNTKYLRIYRFPLHDELRPRITLSELGPDEPTDVLFDFGNIPSSSEEVPKICLLQNQCPLLQTLIMDGVVLNHSNASCRFTLLKTSNEISNLPLHLSVLSVRRCQIAPLFFFYFKIAADASKDLVLMIKVLDCTKCIFFGDSSLRFLLPRPLPFLQELYLAGCPISDFGISVIAAAIPGLKVLDIEMTKVSGYSLTALDVSCQLLEQLFIGSSLIKDGELRRVQPGSLCNLQVICLKGTRTSWMSRRSLISSLPTLQSINGVSCNQVLYEELPEDYCEMCDHFLLREKDSEV